MDCLRSIVLTFSFALGAFALCGCSHVSAKVESLGAIPDFTLTDQTGAEFSSAKQLHDVDWIADFIYTTCPGPCPRMSSQMHEVEKQLANVEGVRLVSFTVDPTHDTPPVLDEYAKRFGAKPGVWFFLTGPEATLQHLSRDAFKLGDVSGNLEHSTRFVLVDRKSQIRGYYLTSEPDAITRLVADTKALQRRERD
jgi:protein SCO1